MSFPAYSEYKNIGIEWLGRVPKHWQVAPLKRGYNVRLGKMLQTELKGVDDVQGNYLRAANIQWSGVDISDIRSMWLSPWERNQLRLQKGDLLVSEGGDVGRSAIWEDELHECYFQNSINRVRSKENNYTRFLYYCILTIKSKGYIDIICNKSTISHFTAEKLAEIPVVFPPLEEQTAIAAFLDRETGKIDALIGEQEKLLTLLAEKRQATISHAVTRGLNPNAPMKDSGVAWLGEVPEHWDIQRIKDLTSVISKGTTPTTIGRSFSESGVRFLKAENIFDSKIQTTPENFIDEDTHLLLSRSNLLSGDVLIVIAGATTGKSAIVNDSIVPCNTNQAICFIRPKKNKYTEVMQYWIQSRGVQNFIKDMAVQSAQPNLSMEDLGNIHIAFSSDSKERLNIKKYIENHDIHISKISKLIEQSIALLKERRSALIAAAVTGKIDVRNAVPQGEAA